MLKEVLIDAYVRGFSLNESGWKAAPIKEVTREPKSKAGSASGGAVIRNVLMEASRAVSVSQITYHPVSSIIFIYLGFLSPFYLYLSKGLFQDMEFSAPLTCRRTGSLWHGHVILTAC